MLNTAVINAKHNNLVIRRVNIKRITYKLGNFIYTYLCYKLIAAKKLKIFFFISAIFKLDEISLKVKTGFIERRMKYAY